MPNPQKGHDCIRRAIADNHLIKQETPGSRRRNQHPYRMRVDARLLRLIASHNFFEYERDDLHAANARAATGGMIQITVNERPR